MTLRYRIILTLLPLLVLLLALGGTAVFLLQHLGRQIDAILRENYDSVIYMERLNEAVERVDSSFQFALAGREEKARQQYQANWKTYRDNLRLEQNNITLPGEADLVAQLMALTERYDHQGQAFYQRRSEAAQRRQDYFGPGGLLSTFESIKDVSGKILQLNQNNMEDESRHASTLARESLIWFGVGLAAAVLLAALSAWHTIRVILQPIQAATQTALAIGAGNLDQVMPVQSRDELGRLATAINTMARQLREYRRSDYSRLLRAQRTSQATIDSFPHPVVVVDSEGCVEMANPAAQRWLGVVARKDGQTVSAPWQPPEELRQPVQEALQTQRPYLPEGFDRLVSLSVDGQQISLLPRILPIRDPYGNTLGAAVLLENVTRFRLLDQVKSDLVATVSHELKTPLTSVRLALHLLLEEIAGPLTPKQTELLLDARDNAERLLDRVNNLLDLARLEQQPQGLTRRPVPPATLLQSAADTIRPRAADKGVAVEVEAPADLPLVAIDEPRLEHALGNLLDNALAYTERGGHIRLKAEADGHTVRLTVADTGLGIPAEYLPHVFDKFFRIPGQSRGSGTGLGLAIVREIVQAHGGTIAVESKPGAGTTFHLSLPIWRDPDLVGLSGLETLGSPYSGA